MYSQYVSTQEFPVFEFQTLMQKVFLHSQKYQMMHSSIRGAFACSSFGVWNAVLEHFQFFCFKVRPKSAFYCVGKWIWSCEKNSTSESTRASLQCQGYQNVKTNYQWSLSYSMVASRVASLLRNRPWNKLHNFFVLRHARYWEGIAPMRPKLHLKPLHFFNCVYSLMSDIFCLRLAESTRIELIMLHMHVRTLINCLPGAREWDVLAARWTTFLHVN